MELQHVVWTLDAILFDLNKTDPNLARATRRSVRPLEAERRRDGKLIVALGCWWPADLAYLDKEDSRSRLDNIIGATLEDRVRTVFAPWPSGFASPDSDPISEEIQPPSILPKVPDPVRDESLKCESTIQRYFFGRVYQQGITLLCQQQVSHYRLDFVVPKTKIGAEVAGWDWHRSGRGRAERRDREYQLEALGWRVIWFSGQQVLEDVERCVSELKALAPVGLTNRTPGSPRHQRWSPPRRY